MSSRSSASIADWPALPEAQWEETRATLHMWTQVVGKIRMMLTPPQNHWWHVTLFVTPRGLTTGLMHHGRRGLEIGFDLQEHLLRIETSDGEQRNIALEPMSVADFYRAVMRALLDLDLRVAIYTTPSEVPDAIPFETDTEHAAYDAVSAMRFGRILLHSDRVLRRFGSLFLGKQSPIQFFWGSFDLAATRFSGRRAPEHPGVPGVPDIITREAYSHEVSSVGFWPGGRGAEAAFYAYAYPEPAGYREASVRPAGARYVEALGEFVLPYEVVRHARSPDAVLMEFFTSTYAAAADLGRWDRASLERAPREIERLRRPRSSRSPVPL